MSNLTKLQQAHANELVAYYVQRMLAEARRTRACTVDQLLDAMQRVVSRGYQRQDESPKQIGKRAAEMARQLERTMVPKQQLEGFNSILKPHLTLVVKE